MTRILASIVLALGAMIWCAPASAQELSGPCPVGQKVSDREGNTGIVADTDPVGCHVQMPDGTKKYYLSWMLHLAGHPIVDPRDIASIKPGSYTCFTGQPLHYIFMDINIKSTNAYTDVKGNPGTYSYNRATQLIVPLRLVSGRIR